jgi:carboxyl-terminal processing protease
MTVYKNPKSSVRLPLFISIAICVGMFIGANMVEQPTASNQLIQNLAKFRQVLTYIENDYVDEVDSEKLVESAIENMLKELDPHTSYIPKEDAIIVQAELNGNYEGIGLEFNIFKDTIHVVSPLSGGPSEKLGILPGDKIILVDGKNVTNIGMTNEKVVRMLRGPEGSEVSISILRKGSKELLDFNIIRDVIPQYSVDTYYMIDDEIGYVKVSRFANSTYLELKNALLNLKDSGMKKLILDLSGNPGGYLPRAVEITDEFIPGRKMIVYTDGKEKKYTESYFSGEEGDFEEGPLVIMLDEGSASASEIVAGAIQDHDRGLIVGRRSFGKGLVQLPIDLTDGSELRLTISRYYTPSGRSIQKPYEGDLDDYYREAYNRFQTGEVYSSDSIKLDDSLAYRTEKGRIVYGGGGITPDHFVPLDTSQSSAYVNRLFSSNTMQEYTVKFAQDNNESLNEMGYEKFRTSFQVTNEMLDELIKLAESNNQKFDEVAYLKSKELIRLLTKAYIARGIWESDGFYPIFNQQDEIYRQAIKVLQDPKLYTLK